GALEHAALVPPVRPGRLPTDGGEDGGGEVGDRVGRADPHGAGEGGDLVLPLPAGGTGSQVPLQYGGLDTGLLAVEAGREGISVALAFHDLIVVGRGGEVPAGGG